MQFTKKCSIVQVARVRVHALVVFSLLMLAVVSRMPDSQAGWVTCPPYRVMVVPESRGHVRRGCQGQVGCSSVRGRWLYLARSCHIALLRSLVLWGLWHFSGQAGSSWMRMVPWLLWLWQGVGDLWPWLGCQPEWRGMTWLLWQVQRLLMMAYLGLTVGSLLRLAWADVPRPVMLGMVDGESSFLVLGLGCLVCGRGEGEVEVVGEAGSGYAVTLCGHFTMWVAGDDPLRVRFLRLFLRQLEMAGPQRKGRRTRDGRTPFISQQQLATWFKMHQPDISREEKYWLEADWPNLLSENTVEVLTWDLVARIVEVFTTFPWWKVDQVWQHMHDQGVAVSKRQVRQAAEQSGWSQLRQELVRRYDLTAEGLRPQDNWLVEQLLGQVEMLLSRLEAGEGLTSEEQMAVADVQTLAAETGVVTQSPLQALPWLMRVERVVFGHWEEVSDGQVRCTYCGSTQVARKSRKPRWKKYYDAEGNLQTVEVYRYYCRNKLCDKGSFTNLPPGLMPYSRFRAETHLLAMQMYAWGYSTYRRTGQALGVTSMTVYRWVSAWGYDLLSVAVLFGVVKSSGAVGIDEKYVLVPKNDKAEGKMRRWMYVYFAVDVYTYDLLHIAIYPHNDKDSAHAFLLAFRAKGYHPKVIVTDQRRDYGPLIARVFPKAVHHHCIFHALQNVQEHVKEVYGPNYAESHPEAKALKQQIYHIFDAKTKRTAQKRYHELMALRERYVQETPAAANIFDFLERHWCTLLNGIESNLIPRTNNTVVGQLRWHVIRRFDQHYQNFCGFENIETAQLFLGVFEKVYRFTPFSQDAQPRIRGKCPLQLADYDINQVPMASLCAGLSITWPLEVAQNLVPNS